MKRYFPIQTETACKLKWAWNTIRLYTGESGSCHRVNTESILVDKFSEFHNSPKKLVDRQLMLDGKWPIGGCEYCRDIELAGGSSDRLFHLKVPGSYPAILDTNPVEIKVTPTILEVYLDNVCNMSCVYCCDAFSSKLQHENEVFGRFDQFGVIIDNKDQRHPEFEKLKEKFWEWMEDQYQTIDQLHLLGGEPFYQKDLVHFLEFLETHKNPKLELTIVTNLMVPTEKLSGYIQRIKKLLIDRKIGRFDLTVSIDCFGKEQEYVRHGLDLEVWKKNFDTLVNEKWITLNINQTVSGLTINSMLDLLTYINEKRLTRVIGQYMGGTSMTYEFLHPKIFGPGVFTNAFSAILDNMPETNWQYTEAKICMSGIFNQVESSSRNQQAINQLAVYLTELDRRRGTSWQKTFPWLIQEVTDVV